MKISFLTHLKFTIMKEIRCNLRLLHYRFNIFLLNLPNYISSHLFPELPLVQASLLNIFPTFFSLK